MIVVVFLVFQSKHIFLEPVHATALGNDSLSSQKKNHSLSGPSNEMHIRNATLVWNNKGTKESPSTAYCCQGVCCAGRGNTGTVGIWSKPPPIGAWLCCHPIPVLWLTKSPWRNGLVTPVLWGKSCCGSCCCVGWIGIVLLRANGLVPVGWACSGEGVGWNGDDVL